MGYLKVGEWWLNGDKLPQMARMVVPGSVGLPTSLPYVRLLSPAHRGLKKSLALYPSLRCIEKERHDSPSMEMIATGIINIYRDLE